MASSKIIPFPNSIAKADRIRMKEARLEELEWENSFMHHEKNELSKKYNKRLYTSSTEWTC